MKQFSIPVAEDNKVPYFDSLPEMFKQLINYVVSNAQRADSPLTSFKGLQHHLLTANIAPYCTESCIITIRYCK